MQTRFDQSFERANLVRYFACLGACPILAQCWPWESIALRVVAAFAGLVAGYFVASFLERLAIQFRKCPQCKTRIGVPTWSLGRDAIRLPCENCQIWWDLGIKNPAPDNYDDDRYDPPI